MLYLMIFMLQVQASNGMAPETLHIPLPLCEKDEQLCPGVSLLARELCLQSEMGYIEVQRDAQGQWTVYDILYGVPLFNDAVAEVVVRRMQELNLLGDAALAAHVAHSASLANRLRLFIQDEGALLV